jgi:hypothetical protein
MVRQTKGRNTMLKIGEYLGRGKNRKRILEIVELSNGWALAKTENTKSVRDFKVRTVTDPKLKRFYTPKHAHFAIDFFGKLCQDEQKAKNVFKAIVEVWHKKDVKQVIEGYTSRTQGLAGYNLDYILYGLNWILEQEDINFLGRPTKLQEKLDEKCQKMGIKVPKGRAGSQLAISLFCDVAGGVHPVEALLAANLDVVPRFRRR